MALSAVQIPSTGGGGGGGGSVTQGTVPWVVSGTVGISGTVPVSGTFWQTTQPVSIASMPTTPVTGTFWQTTQPVSGTVTVQQATASNLLAQVSNNGTFAVQAAQTGTWTVGSNSATGSTVPANAFYNGAQARSSEQTAGTNGNLIGFVSDLTGKLITMPYANKENFLSGVATATGTTAANVISAQGAGVKIYITRAIIANTGATTSLVTIQDNPTSTPTTLAYAINPAGGGSNMVFDPPLVSTANHPVGWTPGSSSSTQYVTLIGYAGS